MYRHSELDDRQLGILRHLDGRSAAEAAERLDCSLTVLAEQLVALRAVLGVQSTAAAVNVVRALGLI